jgi:hypothetical protein
VSGEGIDPAAATDEAGATAGSAGVSEAGRWAGRLRTRLDPGALFLLLIGAGVLAAVSHLRFLTRQDANWDLLNYHAYLPQAILSGTWAVDFHPASIQSYFVPYQDLLLWPLVSGLPAMVATLLIATLQLSIVIPLALILQVVHPSMPRTWAFGVALIGAAGSMVVTELGGTMGDIPPAILGAWALYLLLSSIGADARRPALRSAAAGVLVAAAIAAKLTIAYIAPGMVAVALLLPAVRKWRAGAAFVVSLPTAFALLYGPWALVLSAQAGSPVFPLYNAIFRAPRYPEVSFSDTRFPVDSVADLAQLPLRLAQGVARTAELQFVDWRWVLAFAAICLGAVGAVAWRIRDRARSGNGPAANRVSRELPAFALFLFWVVSFATWAHVFGIQRYAILLEVLALPVVFAGVALAWPRLPRNGSLALAALAALLLAGTTSPVDFGHRAMTSGPIVPAVTLEPLTPYDAVVVGVPPLAYLRAVTRDAPGAGSQVWLGDPFDAADRAVADRLLAGRTSIGVIYYPESRSEAERVAADLGLVLSNSCRSFDNTLASQVVSPTVIVCAASRTSQGAGT